MLFRIAIRRILRRPGFALIVVALLATAVGINATVLSVLDAVAFRDLPYPNAERLVDIRLAQRGCELCTRETVPAPIVDEWKRSVQSVDRWAAIHSISSGLILTDRKRDISGEAITPAALSLLGARMRLGRAFVDDDDRRGGPRQVIFSADFWRREFASDPGMVGQFVRINNASFDVIGVLDRSFSWPGGVTSPDVFVMPSSLLVEPAKARVIVIARLAGGATVDKLNAELRQAGDPLVEQLLGRGNELHATAIPLSRSIAFARGLELAAMQLLAFVVLAVACANAGGLLIARQQAERHLIGMRVVLGARARDLFGLSLLDAAPPVMIGTVLGLVFASRAAPFAGPYLGASVPEWTTVSVNLTVVIVTLIVAVVASLAIAMAPTRELFRSELRSWIQTGSQATAGTRQARNRQQILVGAQIGISTTLLVVAAVLVVNLRKLAPTHAGLDAYGTLNATFTVPDKGNVDVLATAVASRLRSVPGVADVSFTRMASADRRPDAIVVDGSTPGSRPARVLAMQIGPGFTTRDARRMVAGRHLAEDEIRRHADNVVVVNESMARAFWHSTDVIGKRIRFADGAAWRSVVGVEPNIAYSASATVASDPAKVMATYKIPGIDPEARSLFLVVTTERDADRFVASVARAIDEVAAQSVSMLLPNSRLIAAKAEARVRTVLVAVLAVLALGIATVGVSTLVAFSTGLRDREFGIRTAMGATAAMIGGEVLRDAVRMSGKGLLLGAVGTIGAYFVFIPLVYFNAKIFDWRIAVGAMVLMTLLIVMASVTSAVRAARLNPADVLRGS